MQGVLVNGSLSILRERLFSHSISLDCLETSLQPFEPLIIEILHQHLEWIDFITLLVVYFFSS